MKKPDIFIELEKAVSFVKNHWDIQSDDQDKKTNFIYNCFSFEQLKDKVQSTQTDFNYAVHRWFNFHTSKACEDLFAHYGAKKEKNEKNRTIDFFFNDVNFDLKLTVYPMKLNKILDLNKRADKNFLIQWLYKNQSQQGRMHLENRLFIVCRSEKGYYDSISIKANFDLLNAKIKSFFHYFENKKLNEVNLQINGIKKIVVSDIIYVGGK